ncbi:MAG TPA: Flp family type IVb pilin [Bdellovibrionota bacterium]|nr:Flp family type IVb pilin [Bdellovibrionota bacterium]
MKSERGQTVIEYLLICAAVATILIMVVPYIRGILWGPEDKGVGVLKQGRETLENEHFKDGDKW